MRKENILYNIAISIIPNVGPLLTKRLIAYAGGIEAVFKEKKNSLLKVPGIGELIVKGIINTELFEKAEKELDFIEKNNIRLLNFLDDDYPERLKQCEDCPINIYIKGDTDLNASKMISVVGTRNATNYGMEKCESLIKELSNLNHKVTIVSGLAFGIDICAHIEALKNKQETIAVLGHGINLCYPSLHKNYFDQIAENGCVISEFLHDETPERGNFVSRNRIIAGLCDATIVVESGTKGGALITAGMANSYHREVFAFPGRTSDTYSKGCNKLIKNNEAALIENADDLIKNMMWEENAPQHRQTSLFIDLSSEEQSIMECLSGTDEMYIDKICLDTGLAVQKVSSHLLNMEFNGLIKSLPGKMYKVVR